MTKIEYLDKSWNPIQDKRKGSSGRGYHCTKISPGCRHCWAESVNQRFGNGYSFEDTTVEFEIIEKELRKPLHWKKPRRVGVQFMGDLFHEWVTPDLIDQVFQVMAETRHTYFLLTKRPRVMVEYYRDYETREILLPDNVYFGLSVCNQEEADKKIPILLQVPGKKWLSIEPMLGAIDLCHVQTDLVEIDVLTGDHGVYRPLQGRSDSKIDWVVLGGESGSKARPMRPDWVRSIRDQCIDAEVSFYFKQWGTWCPDDFTTVLPSGRTPKRCWIHLDGAVYDYQYPYNCTQMMRLGKKYTPILDGRTWDQLTDP